MADISFHHGTRVFESTENPVLIRTAQSAVIALFGTADDADATVFPLNQPVLVKGASNYTTLASKLGAAGTLKRDLDAIYDQGGVTKLGAYVYIIRVTEGVDADATIANLVGDSATLTGVHAVFKIEQEFGRKLKPRIFVAPGWTQPLSANGVNAINVTLGGTGYTDDTVSVAITDGGGQGAEAKAVLTAGVVTGFVITKPGFGYTSAPTVTITDTGVGADATAAATTGTVGNPVAHELEGILAKFRAVAFIDGPNTSDAAAVITREKYGSQRLYICDPYVQVYDSALAGYVSHPSSARFAGVQTRVDREVGFYKSVSNEPIHGIDGLSRAIHYGEQTNYLNENAVNTVVNFGEGFRTWGNRNTGAEDVWKFLAVRRTADFINEAIENAFLEFVDKPMTAANIKLIIESGRAFLRQLENESYVLKGSSDVWVDADLNSATEMAQGRLSLSVKFEPPAPIEDLRAIAHRNIAAYSILLDSVAATIEEGPLSIAA